MPATTDLNSTEEAVERTAIALILEHGYDAITADDLAVAAGLSRATFFRRYGSKDDVVFADHERLLQQLSSFLDQTTIEPAAAVNAAARLVLDHHLASPDRSFQRYELIREHASLRSRELLLIPRYERLFADYLDRSLPNAPQWAVAAFAAAIVAVHNVVLRSWLKDQRVDAGAQLESDLTQLTAVFLPTLNDLESGSFPEVIAVKFAPGSGTEQVLRAVESALRGS